MPVQMGQIWEIAWQVVTWLIGGGAISMFDLGRVMFWAAALMAFAVAGILQLVWSAIFLGWASRLPFYHFSTGKRASDDLS